jgi:hypothetical protein
MLIVWAGRDGPMVWVSVRPTGFDGRYTHVTLDGSRKNVEYGHDRLVRPGEGTESPLGHVMGTYGLLVDLC